MSVFPSFPVGPCLTHRREFPAALSMPATEVLRGIHEGKNNHPLCKKAAGSKAIVGFIDLFRSVSISKFLTDLEKV